MSDIKKKHPSCFGVLDHVFPKGKDGLRNTPENCFACLHKTECLRSAIKGTEGVKVKEEMVDRAYDSGVIGFLERWSRKKGLCNKIKKGKGDDYEID